MFAFKNFNFSAKINPLKSLLCFSEGFPNCFRLLEREVQAIGCEILRGKSLLMVFLTSHG